MLGWLNDVFSTPNSQQQAQVGAAAGQSLSQGGITTPLSSIGTNPTVGPGSDNVVDTATQNSSPGFWSKDGGAGLVLGGVQVLGNLWNSYQSNKIAKEQLGFAREQWDTNLRNQTQTYNTALEDRIRARHHTEGKGAAATDAYLNENRL